MIKSLLAALLFLLSPLFLSTSAPAQDVKFYRIGTGGIGGTYYPMGAMIANAISNPPGSVDCNSGGSCGVPGLVAVAQSSHGSLDNALAIAEGRIDSGFVQSDVLYWAYNAQGIFLNKEPLTNLRALASLYTESLHVVASKESGIKTIEDLKGKRVSLGAGKSGTLIEARLLLKYYGLSEKDIQPFYVDITRAEQMLRNGELDAFFELGGYPIKAVSDLADEGLIDLISLEGPKADTMLVENPFLNRGYIPSNIYNLDETVQTLTLSAIWVTSAEQDPELVTNLMQAIWHPKNRAFFDSSHRKGREVNLQTAEQGVAIPFHRAAFHFYESRKNPPTPEEQPVD